MGGDELKMDERAPDFKGIAVHDGMFKEVSLTHFKGKYLILLFYPLDFNNIFPTTLSEVPADAYNFSSRLGDFQALNCEVMGVSTDSHYVHLAYSELGRDKGGLGSKDMYLFADNDLTLSTQYGFLKTSEGLAFNGIVILNRKAEVKHMCVSDFPVGFDVEEIIRLIFAIQTVEESGYDKCAPMDWKPSDTLIDLQHEI